ncbi:anti-sigma factor [Actinoplanes sp. TBRC 11911]|uniref:anti-sigma factor n=1 Tax=Actinoplanes sp. TBRC 11911 TaxID=2729386 RepID=UPI00145E7D57|nr:anti-sigma factor [Actinoplanes sp. TBRC 11911]NMO52486.1 anti-sigma factor [Actinoplanes sp. TBRC 11911]
MSTEIHALLGAYVLDAVDDVERARFDRHLRECGECRAEADELREAAARLADGAWSAPPPSLRANVLAAIATTRQVAPAVPVAPRRPVARWRLLTAAACVAVAAAGAATVTWVVQDQRVRDAQAAAESARSGEARVRAILTAPDLVTHQQALAGGGRVTVAVSRLHDAGVILMTADTAPDDERVYQLWTVRARAAVSEGALAVGQTTAVRVIEGLTGVSDVGVTVEPRGGSAAPTLPMAADVKLA